MSTDRINVPVNMGHTRRRRCWCCGHVWNHRGPSENYVCPNCSRPLEDSEVIQGSYWGAAFDAGLAAFYRAIKDGKDYWSAWSIAFDELGKRLRYDQSEVT